MALVNIDSIQSKVLNALKKMAPPQGMEILSYKRNRGISILLQEEGTLWVREHGYRELEFEIPCHALGKLLKSLLKVEFPRSRKVRFYQLGGPEELNQPRKKL